MKKIKKIKERILSIALTFVMVMSLLVGMAPVEVHAEEGEPAAQAETCTVTIDSTNLAEGALLAALRFDSDGYEMGEPIELTNGSIVEIPKDGGLLVMSNSSNFKVTVSDTTLAKVGDLMVGQAESGYYISEIKDNITVVVESTTQGGGNENPPAGGDGVTGDISSVTITNHIFDDIFADIQDGTLNSYSNEDLYLHAWPKVTVLNKNGEVLKTYINNPYIAHRTNSGWEVCDCGNTLNDSEHGILLLFQTDYNHGNDQEDLTSIVSIDSDTLVIDKAWADYSIYPRTGAIYVAIVPGTSGGNENPPATDTYDITLDRTNYAEGYVDLYTYDGEGSYVANTEDNNATITMPEGGKVRVFADSEFTVTAEGATISEMLSAGEEGYYYELTGITADTTIVVNKGNTGSGDNVIDAVDVQVDWTKVPTLEKGMTEVPSMDQVPGTYTVNGASAYGASWAVKIDETYKITPEDSYYNELKAMESVEDSYGDIYTGEEFIENYNDELDFYIEVYSGMLPIQVILSNPYYAINEEDTYAMYIGFMADKGKTFGGTAGEAYKGTLTSNLDILCQFVDGNGEALVVFFKLGTLAEMEEEKNEAGGTHVVPATIYDITLDRTNYAEGYVDLYTYDGEGRSVENTQENNDTITMPEGGKVRVFADSEFTVTAEGATISEMLSAGEEGYYYELTGITADTTIVVNLKQNTPVVVAPAITSQPQNISVQEGQKATFSVTATGDNLSYQWQINRNDGNGFVNLSGATSASYTTSAVDMDCNGFKYQCIVSNEGGSVTTNIATLIVTESTSVHTHSLTLVPAKAATCTTAGNKAYYTCSGCDSLFADANGTTITTAEAVKVAALDHDWTGEWTIIKEATETEDGKKETLCTRGCGHKKVAIIPATGTTDDNGNLEKDVEIAPDASIDEATLNNSKEELLEADNIFTETEKTQIANGTDASVWIEISKTDESAIASTDNAKIEQEAAKIMGNNPTITYFDVDLFKQVGSGAKQEITEPGIAMKITIVIPDELLNTDKKVSREYKIIRLHEGQVDVINGTFDSTTGEFTFETDKFSTYAIVYKDVPVNDDDDKKDEVPKTGDSNTTLYSFILMLLSGLGIIICSGKKTGNR